MHRHSGKGILLCKFYITIMYKRTITFVINKNKIIGFMFILESVTAGEFRYFFLRLLHQLIINKTFDNFV